MENDTQDAIPEQPSPTVDAVEEIVTGEAESSPEEDTKKPDSFQERINELTRHWRETERDRDHWREMAQRTFVKPDPPKEPESVKKLADFDYDDGKYQEYLFNHAEQRAVLAAERRIREETEHSEQRRRQESYRSKEDSFSKNVKDYYEVTRNPDLAISKTMAEIIARSDDGPSVALYLGRNPDIADRISLLSDIDVGREMGRIEMRLSNERETAKAKSITGAPPPPEKIKGVVASVSKEPPDMSDKEYSAWRRKRMASRT